MIFFGENEVEKAAAITERPSLLKTFAADQAEGFVEQPDYLIIFWVVV